MKKFSAIILAAAMLLSVAGSFTFSAFAAMPSKSVLGGYENIVLTYTFNTGRSDNGRHTVDDLMPYVAYLDKDGNIQDYFFDSYLFLPCNGYAPSGVRMHYVPSEGTTIASDWTAYVEDTFKAGYNVSALNTAFGRAKTALGGSSSKKAGVFLTILYPAVESKSFGTLGGRSLNLSKMDDRKYAIKWIIDEQIKLFEAGGYSNLDLVGFYWLEEYLNSNTDKELFTYASNYLHSLGYKFIWIPYFNANGYTQWKSLGFDFASLQPNHYFSGTVSNRVSTSSNLSGTYGLGVEMEVDSRAAKAEYYNRYLQYLDVGRTSGAMNSIKTYYQDGKEAAFYNACYSANPVFRSVYDLTYKYAKGTLKASDIDYNFAVDFGIPKDVNWVSIGKSYTSSGAYTGDVSMPYQDISGKELTDGDIGEGIEFGTEWHGFHNSLLDSDRRMSVTVDLGRVRNDITDFMAVFQNYQRAAVGIPIDIRIYVSEDGADFTLAAQPSLTEFDNITYFRYTSTEEITARYVKMSFTAYTNFVFCSEFLVGAGQTADDQTNASAITIDVDNNVAAGKPYTTSLPYRQGGADVGWAYDPNAEIDYPDSGNELTDCWIPNDDNYLNAGWVGLHDRTPDIAEAGLEGAWVAVDLEARYDITRVAIYLPTVDQGAAYNAAGLSLPFLVRIYVSDDGKSWTNAAELDEAAIKEQNANYSDVITAVRAKFNATGRYVRAEYCTGGWAFISEITVVGTPAKSSGNTSSGNTSSGNTSSGNTSSGNTSPGNTSSGNTSSGGTSSGNTSSGNTSSGNTSSDDTDNIMLGDVNGNGIIDMSDYIILKRAYFNTYILTERQEKAGDITKNGKIDMTDYIFLKRAYFGTIVI